MSENPFVEKTSKFCQNFWREARLNWKNKKTNKKTHPLPKSISVQLGETLLAAVHKDGAS
jgi:hypothetical protein